jgi:hypothetical protein
MGIGGNKSNSCGNSYGDGCGDDCGNGAAEIGGGDSDERRYWLTIIMTTVAGALKDI